MTRKRKKIQRIHVLSGILVIVLGAMVMQLLGGSTEEPTVPSAPAATSRQDSTQPSVGTTRNDATTPRVDRTIPRSFYGTDHITLSYQPFKSS